MGRIIDTTLYIFSFLNQVLTGSKSSVWIHGIVFEVITVGTDLPTAGGEAATCD